MNKVSKGFSYLVLLSAVGMTIWGVAGFIEYLTGATIVIPLQNANFPSGTQFIHWVLITLYGVVFLYGYFSRWQYTPNAVMVICACLATMCFIQTFDFMTREDRYTAYAQEVTIYIVVTLYLFKSKLMQAHFGREMG